jgi:uncharacterized protein (DUF983 family)
MSKRTADNKLISYICGRCTSEVLYRKSEKAPSECPECGWLRGTRSDTDVPSSFKFNLKQFQGG